jgi:hypothetical protein
MSAVRPTVGGLLSRVFLLSARVTDMEQSANLRMRYQARSKSV